MVDWKSLFTARGRSARGRFWAILIASMVAVLVIDSVMASLTFANPTPRWIANGLSLALVAVCAVVAIYNAARRLHDLGRSGWWQTAPIIVSIVAHPLALSTLGGAAVYWGVMAGALIPLAFAVVIGAIPGEPLANRFGDPPRRPKTPTATP